MAAYLSNELAGTTTGTTTAAATGYRPAATVYNSRLKRLRATITMVGQTTSDTLVLGNLPAGATFAFGVLNASATLGSAATLGIGITGSTDKYRTAATFTTANTPTLFGNNAAVAAATPLAAEEQVIGTIAAANLPTAGTFVVDLYYSLP